MPLGREHRSHNVLRTDGITLTTSELVRPDLVAVGSVPTAARRSAVDADGPLDDLLWHDLGGLSDRTTGAEPVQRNPGVCGLVGRGRELGMVDEMVENARHGKSSVLVIRGETGIGKSSLLDVARSRAHDFLITSTSGNEWEMDLPYAGLQQLCRPLTDHAASLPAPVNTMLDRAFGSGGTLPSDRFAVGTAVLRVLASAAEQQPVLCLIDNAQWLDAVSVQTVAFVARRLLAEPVVVVIATRDFRARSDLAGLPELRLHGLREADAAVLLASVLAEPADPTVVERVLKESRGNPQALLDLPQTWTAAEAIEGLAGIGVVRPVSRLDDIVTQELWSLPPDARFLLTLAAAEPRGDPSLLWAAADRLGIDWSAVSLVEKLGLIEFSTPVRFRHPHVRAVAYRAASTRERLDVHAALAEVTDPVTDRDRLTWHRANATITHDDEIASELESAADRATSRGGALAAAALLERAAHLTADAETRA